MALPVNIEDLVHGKTIEWARIELKKGWNAKKIMHTMCAFANDIHNWGGGYIIVGIDEVDGQAKLPPEGIEQNSIDSIQKELLQLSHRIIPNYFPIVEPYVLYERHILVVWCPAGDNRPYSAPVSLEKGVHRNYYVRINSNTVVAPQGSAEYNQLIELAARIPFDDRINNQATVDSLDLGLIREYLQEVKSNLLEDSLHIPFADLCRTMLIAKGPNEDLRPVNVGLMFFCKTPERFFNRAWIELVWHEDNSSKKFKEVYFKGPLQKQLRNALSFIQTNIVKEKVVKHKDKAEADRFNNYPYEAIEEALSNAVYHKSYEMRSPIEVQVFPDKITILSHPGPVPPVNANVLATQRHIIAREYRNRRIGDFLKELHLTEGRGTGFPTIYSAMADNGSPDPVFETDEANYVLVTIPIHKGFGVDDQVSDQVGDQDKDHVFNSLEDVIAFCNGVSDQVSDQARDQARAIVTDHIHPKVSDILQTTRNWIKRSDLFSAIGLTNHSKNRKAYLDPLIDLGLVEMEYPDKRTSPKQRYKITTSGYHLLNLIKQA
ncbi:MAG: putative DNA binding domain-containing protein [Bacteroidetes bacterium]|nr:putative DNA binding domain-containing protein [Bacteroidota bacterium]